MATYSLGDIIDSVETTLSAAASLKRSQSYDELMPGVHEVPLLQVWPASCDPVSFGSQTDRLTLGDRSEGEGHSVKEYVIHGDLYGDTRGGRNIGESMKRLVTAINEMENILDTQKYPLFGNSNLLSMTWRWEFVTFTYGKVEYCGARFYVTVRAGTSAI